MTASKAATLPPMPEVHSNGVEAPENGLEGVIEQPSPESVHVINPHSTAIIQRLVEDEEIKKAAFLAAQNARMLCVETTAAAMGLQTVALTALPEGKGLAFVDQPAQ
jgi:hypothetical protein